jgi:hypothetical protein
MAIRSTDPPHVLLSESFLRWSACSALIAAGVAVSGVLAASCSSSSSPASNTDDAGPSAVLKDPSCVDGGLTIAFNPMYSAFDGVHTYSLPAIVVGSDQQVTWFADSAMVGMQADSEQANEVLLTMLAAGTTTIHVQSADGKCASAPLTISSVAVSDWQIGQKRYNDGISAHISGPSLPGMPSPLEQNPSGGPACTNCHGETATNFAYKNVSHTPEQTGGFSDQQILDIVLHGTFPNGGQDFDWSIVPYPAWHNFHQWTDITTDQQRGIVAYLRSLTPAPQAGAPNFGLFPLDAGMTSVVTEGGSGDGAVESSGGDSTVDAPSTVPDSSGNDVAAESAPSEAGAEASGTDGPSESSVDDGGASEAGPDGGDGGDAGD